MKTLAFVVAISTLALSLVACGSSYGTTPATTPPPPPVATTPPAPPPAAVPPASGKEARDLYAANCQACHGANREGNTALKAPALTPANLNESDDTIDNLAGIISNGVTGTAMPAFKDKLTADQIKALATLIKTVAP